MAKKKTSSQAKTPDTGEQAQPEPAPVKGDKYDEQIKALGKYDKDPMARIAINKLKAAKASAESGDTRTANNKLLSAKSAILQINKDALSSDIDWPDPAKKKVDPFDPSYVPPTPPRGLPPRR